MTLRGIVYLELLQALTSLKRFVIRSKNPRNRGNNQFVY